MPDPVSAQPPSGTPIDKVLEEMRQEFQSLMSQRTLILRRIGTLKQTIMGLSNLLGNDVIGDDLLELIGQKSGTRPAGFTRTCRLVLMESKRPLMSQEVCKEIERRNPNLLTNHKDPIASVCTVLNRLARYGEARIIVNETGRRAWEWATEKSTVTLDSNTGSRSSNGTEEARFPLRNP